MLRLLIETCVHRRVAALFVTGVVAAFGLYAYLGTPIEAYPDVTNTQVMILSKAPGLAAVDVEQRVSYPIEQVMRGLPRVPMAITTRRAR